MINGKNVSLLADLIKKQVVYYDGDRKRIYNFKNSNKNSEYKKQHLAILTNKCINKLCTFNEGKKIVYLIDQIKFKSKTS